MRRLLKTAPLSGEGGCPRQTRGGEVRCFLKEGTPSYGWFIRRIKVNLYYEVVKLVILLQPSYEVVKLLADLGGCLF